jgi:predicted ribosome quality control (RQC) complex YloA/Tae2 family protein
MFDFYSMSLYYLKPLEAAFYNSISDVIEEFFFNKDKSDRVRQKSSDILKVINTNLSRCYKKLAIQQEKLMECTEKDRWKLYGDLITANIYTLKKGDSCAAVINYYDENQSEIEIPLDVMLTPVENAQRYYKKYNNFL